jgi:hypothetical protein
MTVARNVCSPAKLNLIERTHIRVEEALFQSLHLHQNTAPKQRGAYVTRKQPRLTD